MTLYAYPMDRTGCGFYRVIWPLSSVRDRVSYKLIAPGESGGLDVILGPGPLHKRPLLEVLVPDDCSGVLLQRPTNRLLVQMIPHLRARGIPVLVDVDDDLNALHPQHPTRLALRKPGQSAACITQACDQADLVIASTPALLERYAPHKRGVLLRNRIRSDFRSCLRNGSAGGRAEPLPAEPRVSAPHTHVNASPSPSAHVDVLWPGALANHPHDLDVLRRPLSRLNVHRLTVFGPSPHPHRLDPPFPVAYTGAVPFADYLPLLSQLSDEDPPVVGVAPLSPAPASRQFNLSKSWLKPLEFAATGIPFVHSDTPEYRLLGAGLRAQDDSPKAWYRLLRQLMRSPDLRQEERERNLQIAEANTYAVHADEWHAALEPFTHRPAPAAPTKEPAPA